MKVYPMALLLGVAIGAIAVQGLHAQEAKPKSYAVSEKGLAEPADKTALLSELMKLEAGSWQSLKDKNVMLRSGTVLLVPRSQSDHNRLHGLPNLHCTSKYIELRKMIRGGGLRWDESRTVQPLSRRFSY